MAGWVGSLLPSVFVVGAVAVRLVALQVVMHWRSCCGFLFDLHFEKRILRAPFQKWIVGPLLVQIPWESRYGARNDVTVLQIALEVGKARCFWLHCSSTPAHISTLCDGFHVNRTRRHHRLIPSYCFLHYFFFFSFHVLEFLFWHFTVFSPFFTQAWDRKWSLFASSA